MVYGVIVLRDLPTDFLRLLVKKKSVGSYGLNLKTQKLPPRSLLFKDSQKIDKIFKIHTLTVRKLKLAD